MSNSINYNPKPTRAWSRVQSSCTYVQDNSYNSVYVPSINKTLTLSQANLFQKLLQKGNVLQYKKNSSNQTKNEKYSKIAKGISSSRKQSYSTQSQTYTNPNTNSFQRVNTTSIPFPNQIVGSPNNISGPYQYYLNSTVDCCNNLLTDGGSLIGNKYVNQCTGEIIQSFTPQNWYLSYCSDVPGPIVGLYWNSKIATWNPRQNKTMNNSANKFPEGYKAFVSAATPVPPVVILDYSSSTTVTISWTISESIECMPISSFNIYLNGKLYINVPYNIFTSTITLNQTTNNIYMTSLSTTIESAPSNVITYTS